jgi:hypothetical protein
MRNSTSYKLFSAVALSVLFVNSTIAFADSQTPRTFNDRPVNVGNFQEIESGMNPVVIKPSRPDLVPSNGQNKNPGALYTATSTDTTAITYSVGKPILNTPNVYLVWYGSWNSTATKSTNPVAKDYFNFTNTLLTNLNSSSRWSNIMKPYYSRTSGSATKNSVGNLSVSGNQFLATNTSLYGSVLTQTSVLKIAKAAFPTVDLNGIYLVLTSSDVPVSGFNYGRVQFCGYHGFDSTTKRVYGFVGDAAAQAGCQAQSTSPNGNAGADSTASVLIHEIEEATTDPQLNAWWSSTSTGNENADKCAWSWGTTSSANGAFSNYTWNGANYLIQQEFKLASAPKSSTTTLDTYNGSCSQA